MRKKKIVAAMLAAAMTVTSFLPAGGLFKPVTAQAATVGNLAKANSLTFALVKSGSSADFTVSAKNQQFEMLDTGKVDLVAAAYSTEVPTGDTLKTSWAALTANLKSEDGLKVTSTTSIGTAKLIHTGQVTTAAINSKAGIDITLLTGSPKKVSGVAISLSALSASGYGKVNVVIQSGDTALFNFDGVVKTQKVSLGAMTVASDVNNSSSSNPTNELRASVSSYVYGANTKISDTYTSVGALSDLKYGVYRIPVASAAAYNDAAKVSPEAVYNSLASITDQKVTVKDTDANAKSNAIMVSSYGAATYSIPKSVGLTEKATYVVVTSNQVINDKYGNKGARTGAACVVSGVSYIASTTNQNNTTTNTTDNNSNNNNNNNSSTTDNSGTTKTTETTKDDGTKEQVTETTDSSGTKTTTTTDTKPDGSVTETTVVENTDGSKTTTVKETNADGSTKESTEVKNADGSSTLKSTETKADGTKTTVDSATTAAGDTKSTEVTTYPAGSAVKTQTTESDVKANGNSVVVVTKENSDSSVEIASETKNSAGETAVTYEAAAGSSNVTVSDIDTTAKSVTIPAKITAAGKTYKVTKLGAKALKGNKTATKVTVGKNIKNIGKQAFQNASKLKTIKINGNVTTIGKNSFKGIKKNATITIKATKKQYKAMVKKIKKAGGAPTKVTYKRA